jgi:formylglycine-generating enzyme required for sulfatase activity
MKRMENLKSVILLLGALACLPLVFSCSNSQSISSGENQSIDVEITADSLQGMLRVSVAKAEVVLGTADEQARQNERPKMKVAIDYSFSVGRHEVTCKEFNALMKDETGLVLDCDNGKLPATNLTYYDAVLFANARSHSEGFDSAYSYTGVVLDAEKHCTNLEGFAFHPEKNAYRLPTEAEWVLAASLNWNPSDGWNAKNSDYRLHDVCTISQEEDMPCDMAGLYYAQSGWPEPAAPITRRSCPFLRKKR